MRACRNASEGSSKIAGLAPQRAHTSLTFGTVTDTNVLTQIDHRVSIECLPEISAPTGICRTRDEEAGTDMPFCIDDRRDLGRITPYGRIGCARTNRGEVLVNPAQFLRVLRYETGAKVGRMVAFNRVQNLLELAQVVAAQREVVAEVIVAAECMGIGHIDREK